MLFRCKKPKVCSVDSIDCCVWWLLLQQPNFLEQKSSVQEVIEAAGHLCIFLPKFHYIRKIKKFLRMTYSLLNGLNIA